MCVAFKIRFLEQGRILVGKPYRQIVDERTSLGVMSMENIYCSSTPLWPPFFDAAGCCSGKQHTYTQ